MTIQIRRSLWGQLPCEMRHHILQHADPLTRYLNGKISTESDIKLYRLVIWIVAFGMDWEGDWSILYKSLTLPTIIDGLETVTSKRVYQQLCVLAPHLAKAEILLSVLEDVIIPVIQHIKDNRSSLRYRMHSDDEYVKSMEPLLIHIPFRQFWLDEIPEVIKENNALFFFIASCFGHVQVVQHLLAVFSNEHLNVGPLATFCLVYASEYGYHEVVALLLRVDGVNPSFDREFALSRACKNGHLDVVKLLYKRGITSSEESDFFWKACRHGQSEVVQYLLNESTVILLADLNNTYIRAAAQYGHAEVVKLLLATGEVDASFGGNIAIVLAATNGHAEVVKLLLAVDSVDAGDRNNEAIRKAAANGHTNVVKLLLECGQVDVSADNNYAIRMAAMNGHREIVRLLLDTDRVDATAGNCYALRLATANRHEEVVELLCGYLASKTVEESIEL
ncbi:hypothetical protein HDU76_008631 [Blyttiomyces sp. JEL0837]|nr:hypothetical protein HDU76_008631 [Blyttiomyces sp. JEL0837]